MLIDTHCHLNDKKYSSTRAEIINRAHEAGVGTMICIGCDVPSSESSQAVATEFSSVFFSAGIHPHESAAAPSDYLEKLRRLAAHPRCVAIGECGLDYYYNHSAQNTQKKVFSEQIALAQELRKPLVVHVRDAWEDCLALLKEASDLTVVIHCFSGPMDFAQRCWEQGYYLSFSGIVTFKNAAVLREIAQKTPLSQLLIETDAPYLTPEPYRGRTNEPHLLTQVAQKIAAVREISLEKLAWHTSENARKCFCLSDGVS